MAINTIWLISSSVSSSNSRKLFRDGLWVQKQIMGIGIFNSILLLLKSDMTMILRTIDLTFKKECITSIYFFINVPVQTIVNTNELGDVALSSFCSDVVGKAYPQTTSIFMEQLWDIGIGKYKILCVAEHITCYHLF